MAVAGFPALDYERAHGPRTCDEGIYALLSPRSNSESPRPDPQVSDNESARLGEPSLSSAQRAAGVHPGLDSSGLSGR